MGESHRQVWGHPLAAPGLPHSQVLLTQHPAAWELPVAQFPPQHPFPTALPYTQSSPQPQKCKSKIPPENPNQTLPFSEGDDELKGRGRQSKVRMAFPHPSPKEKTGTREAKPIAIHFSSIGKVFIQVKMFLR